MSDLDKMKLDYVLSPDNSNNTTSSVPFKGARDPRMSLEHILNHGEVPSRELVTSQYHEACFRQEIKQLRQDIKQLSQKIKRHSQEIDRLMQKTLELRRQLEEMAAF